MAGLLVAFLAFAFSRSEGARMADSVMKMKTSESSVEPNSERPSSGLEEWEYKLCIVLQHDKTLDHQHEKKLSLMGLLQKALRCRAWIAEEERNCQETATQCNLFIRNCGRAATRCKTYQTMRRVIELAATERISRQVVARAAAACEPAVDDVCQKTTCPIYCAMRKKADCDCAEMCHATSHAMWGTGEMPCRDDQTFSECYNELHEALRLQGRNPDMEAVLREHTLKCMCVSSRSDDTRPACYEGSKGIQPGTRWCDFYDTHAWTNLIAHATDEMKANFPKPECAEFPYRPDEDDSK